MKRTKPILEVIKRLARSIEPESEIILFGSRARGDERADSDWDIIILVPYQVTLKDEQRFRHELFSVELEYEQPISTFVFSKIDWEDKFKVTPLYQNVQQEGIYL